MPYTCFQLCCYRCGPISRHWCMRFEAKHNYFKSLAQRVKCFKNIAKTLASRHQRLMCYYLSNPLSSVIIKGTKTSKGTLMQLHCVYFVFSNTLLHLQGVTTSVSDYEYKSELKGAIPTLDDSSILTRYDILSAMILGIHDSILQIV